MPTYVKPKNPKKQRAGRVGNEKRWGAAAAAAAKCRPQATEPVARVKGGSWSLPTPAHRPDTQGYLGHQDRTNKSHETIRGEVHSARQEAGRPPKLQLRPTYAYPNMQVARGAARASQSQQGGRVTWVAKLRGAARGAGRGVSGMLSSAQESVRHTFDPQEGRACFAVTKQVRID